MSSSRAFPADFSSGAWRIVVPVRGRLAPKVLPLLFQTKAEAENWIASAEGQAAIYEIEKRPPPVRQAAAGK